MENYCIMVQTGSEEKFKKEAISRLFRNRKKQQSSVLLFQENDAEQNCGKPSVIFE